MQMQISKINGAFWIGLNVDLDGTYQCVLNKHSQMYHMYVNWLLNESEKSMFSVCSTF